MDYKNGKIYSIRSHQTDNIYIGSTATTLTKRFSSHNSHYKQYLKGEYSYMTSFEILKYNDAYIELVETYRCNSSDELNKREGEIIRMTKYCVNKLIAGRTKHEYWEDNKDKLKEYKTEYREANKDQRIHERISSQERR
jgi:hypothetical protein